MSKSRCSGSDMKYAVFQVESVNASKVEWLKRVHGRWNGAVYGRYGSGNGGGYGDGRGENGGGCDYDAAGCGCGFAQRLRGRRSRLHFP